MRLLTILLILSLKIYPQKLIKNYYQYKMEEKSIKEFKINRINISNNKIITLKPNKWMTSSHDLKNHGFLNKRRFIQYIESMNHIGFIQWLCHCSKMVIKVSF